MSSRTMLALTRAKLPTSQGRVYLLLVVALAFASPWVVRADASPFAPTRAGVALSVVSTSRTVRPLRPHGRKRERGAARAEEQRMRRERHWRYEAVLREASMLYTLPVDFLRAVIRVESDFDPNVVSRCGAIGLMQLMPFNVRTLGVRDPFDARENILGGAFLFRKLANQWNGDLALTLASYNAGSGAVQRHGGVPPFRETQGYVTRVLKHYRAYRAGAPLARR